MEVSKMGSMDGAGRSIFRGKGLSFAFRCYRGVVLAVVAAVFLTVSGCASTQTLRLDGDGGAEISGEIIIYPVLGQYLKALQLLGGGSSDSASPVFDIPSIQARFAELEGTELVAISSPTRESLNYQMRLKDLSLLFGNPSEGEQESVRLNTSPEGNGLAVTLTRANIAEFSRYAPALGGDLLSYFIPSVDAGWVSKEEYTEMLEYAFEEYLGEESMEAVLENATHQFLIEVKGGVISQSGGIMKGGRVLYTLPVLELLTLNEPLELGLVFR